MASSAHIDKLTLLEAQERMGGLRRLVREALVVDINTTDWTLLTEALDQAGVPKYRDRLTTDWGEQGYNLILVERNPKIVDIDKVSVELVYESFEDMPEFLDDPLTGLVTGEIRCNIQQKSSNLDINGDQVTVSHTYPADDSNFPGETRVQGGEFQYYEPQRTIHLRGMKETRRPWLIANSIVGRVNAWPWSGEAARTWLCTSCNWKLSWIGRQGYDNNNNHFYMNFEFQHDLDGWDPTVTFVDEITRRPPANLVPGVGYKTITKMPATNFERLIGADLQGG